MLAEQIDWKKIQILAWCQICADTFRLEKSVEIHEIDGRKVTYTFNPSDPPLPNSLLGDPNWDLFEEVSETTRKGIEMWGVGSVAEDPDDRDIEIACRMINAYRFILEGQVNPALAKLNKLFYCA